LPLADFAPDAIAARGEGADGEVLDLARLTLGFRPHFGWVGAIEANGRAATTRR
jgi:hypothetical protein